MVTRILWCALAMGGPAVLARAASADAVAAPSTGTGRSGADIAPDLRMLLADPDALAGWMRVHDPMVDVAQARVEAATAAAAQTRVLPNPALDLEVGNFALGHGNVDPNDGHHGPASVAHTTHVSVGISELFEIGKRTPRRAAAELRVRASSETGLAVLGEHIGDALESLGHLAYVTARRDAVTLNLDAAKKLLALEKVRLDKADLSQAEYARIDLDTDQLSLLLDRANADVAEAIAQCSTALYGTCEPTSLDGTALDAGAPLPRVPTDIVAEIAARPARRADQLEAAALGEDARLAGARAIPDPTVGISYSHDTYNYGGNLPNVAAVTVGIPLTIFDVGKADAQAARATARAIEAQSAAEVRVGAGHVDALDDQLTALANVLSRLEMDAVPKSARIIEQTRRSFDLGQAGLSDLLQVERAHRDLLLQVLDIRFELFTVRLQLRRELGLDDEAARAAIGRKQS